MPELAEVEYHRKHWDQGLGRKVLGVELHATKRIFRGADTDALVGELTGAKLLRSEARGKQLMFVFSGGSWLGIHLGMTGKMHAEPSDFTPGKHDHLVLRQKDIALVFSDSRLFGRVRYDQAKQPPKWWSDIGPALVSPEFTAKVCRERLERRPRAPVKAALLDQKLFPGVGNWMADEILWQARIHPATPSAALSAAQQKSIWQKTREICRTALRTIGRDWGDPPDDWLIHVRWRKKGDCPRHGTPLKHATIAGRTTAWCPRCQPRAKG
jgi:formamidopyrimidine-DNA glycosylase